MIMVTLCNCYNDDMYNNGLVFVIFYINRRSTDSTKEKPLVMHEYNHYMLGVDKLDQLMAYYSFLHKSIKWWRKVFFWMLEVVVVNAYIIYQDTNKRNTHRMTHLQFRRDIIQCLVEPLLEEREVSTSVTPSVSAAATKNPKSAHCLETRMKRRDCVVCSDIF